MSENIASWQMKPIYSVHIILERKAKNFKKIEGGDRMLSYESFKETVAEKILSHMPEKYQSQEVEIRSIAKVNAVKDGLCLKAKKGEMSVFPIVYINDMYENYRQNEDLEEVLQTAAKTMTEEVIQRPRVPKMDMDEAKDNIVFQLVNTEQNREMVSHMPHREFQDLTVMYHWIVKMSDEGIQSILVGNEVAEKLGLSEEQLFKCAMENTKRLLPPCVKSIDEVIREIFSKNGMSEEIADRMFGEMLQEQTMWVLTNNRGINGAVSMLYEDQLHMLSQQLEDDLYVLPSSIHEVIAVSASMGNPNELAEMVTEINMNEVLLEERLSNQVYHYDKDLRKLSLATDTQNKRLDDVDKRQDSLQAESQIGSIINFRDLGRC